MSTTTAFSHALQRAGMNIDESRLRMIATGALAKHHGNAVRAIKTFEKEIDGDGDLIRVALRFYLDRFKLPEDDQSAGAIQSSGVAGRQTNGGGSGPDHQASDIAVASSSSCGTAGHPVVVNHSTSARPVREPSAAERAASAAVAKKISILDTFRVRDGRAIGDVRYGELKRMMATSTIEAAVIKQILDHAQAPHDALVRDIVKIKDMQLIMQRAAEIADAA